MSGKKRILIAVVAIVPLSLVIGGAVYAFWSLGQSTPKIEEVVTSDDDAPSLTEEHWNAENQITEKGTAPEEEETTESSYDNASYPIRSQFDGDRSDDEGMIPIEDFEIPAPKVDPEPDPRTSSVLTGAVQYEDIPEPSKIDGGYNADDIKAEMIKYLTDKYPTEVISEITLIGNGSARSQYNGQDTSYANYLVTFQKGKRIGISVASSNEDLPYVTETNYLVVNRNLLYKVAENEYVPMDAPAEERIPADTVIDHY